MAEHLSHAVVLVYPLVQLLAHLLLRQVAVRSLIHQGVAVLLRKII